MSGPFGSTAWMANPASGFYDFEISNSLRFEDGDSAYLNFTPGTAGNRRTFTFSCWIKHSGVDNNASTLPIVWGSTGTVSSLSIAMSSNRVHSILFYNGGQNNQTTALFRDSSAWYNFVLACDTTQGTATNRTKLYVNGVAVTAWESANYPNQNTDGGINAAGASYIGRQIGQSRYFDGYMAEVNQIDGLALTPSSFGEFKNDIWIPKNTAGLTFGDQGYRLQFKQTGTGTASSSTIGADTSGNDNHWTSNNLVASDVVPDSPTNNFATLNPLDAAANCVISEGNLKYTTDHSAQTLLKGTFNLTNKHYWEVSVPGVTGDASAGDVGIANPSALSKNGGYATWAANTLIYTSHNGNKSDGFGGSSASYGATYTTGDIVGIAVDVPSGTIQFFKNNASQGTITDSTITTQGNTNTLLPVLANNSTSGSRSFIANFGQDSSFAGTKTAQGNADANGIGDFYYAPPSGGFLALCTANMPDPVATIDPAKGGSPQDYFNTVLYNGNGSTQGITGVGFQPDWVWLKNRDTDDSSALTDSVRGVTKELNSDIDSGAESTNADGLTAFGADGFSLGDDVIYNTNSEKYVAWNWKAGTAFSNDASATSVGSIDSAGSVNTDVGFSIIGYTGISINSAGSAGTVAHGLGVAPELIFFKSRSTTNSWVTYATAIGAENYLYLNRNNASADFDNFQDTATTSTVFSLSAHKEANGGDAGSDGTMIAYCFASVEGYSKIGKYTGNGSTDGPFVYTGFRPAFVMTKETSATSAWVLRDNIRSPSNVMAEVLFASRSGAEETSGYDTDFLSNGFKLRNSGGDGNTDGNTFIFMAFAEQPFKYANAR